MEFTENKRLFLAVAISMTILLVWQLFVFEPPSPEEETAAEVEETETVEDGGDAVEKPAADKPVDEAAPEALVANRPTILPQEAVLETDYFRLTLTNVGARAVGYAIKSPDRYSDRENYFDTLLGDDELVDTLPLETHLPNIGLDAHALFEVIPAAEPGVLMRWTSDDGAITVDKHFSPGESDHSVQVEVLVRNNGTRELGDTVAFKLYNRQGEDDAPSIFGMGHPLSAGCLADDDVERVSSGDEAEVYEKTIEWIAVDESYFAAIALVEEGADSCRVEGYEDGTLEASLSSEIDVPAGESTTLSYLVYLGPKETKTLEAFGHDAFRTIDFGWVEILSRPIAWLLVKLFGFFGNWGIAIILLTMMIRGGLWPVTQRSQESMMRMKDIGPQTKELQEKYKNDPAMLQQKQMELFRENNVSPFGCLPLLLQIPIWFALYRTIYVTAELYRAEFGLWIHDLSAPDPYFVLPVIAGGLFFVQQKLSPTAVADVKQKVLMTVFPLVFVVVMLFLPSGLNLYILVSSVIGVAQVVYIRRKGEAKKAKDAAGGGDASEKRSPQTAQERRAEKRRTKGA